MPSRLITTRRLIRGLLDRPQPKDWDDYEHGCLMTFGGGYRTPEEISIFHHGISTVFNLLRREFPPAEQCKASGDLLKACRGLLEHVRAKHNLPPEQPFQCEHMRAIEAAIAKAEPTDEHSRA